MKKIVKVLSFFLIVTFLGGTSIGFAQNKEKTIEKKDFNHTYSAGNHKYIDFCNVMIEDSTRDYEVMFESALHLSERVDSAHTKIYWQRKDKNKWTVVKTMEQTERNVSASSFYKILGNCRKNDEIRAKVVFTVKKGKTTETATVITETVKVNKKDDDK